MAHLPRRPLVSPAARPHLAGMKPVTALMALPIALVLTACTGDETLHAYGAGGAEWRLTELDGAPFAARATLEFPEPGRIAGQAPCNRFFGAQTAPYPWFSVQRVGATMMACPDLEQEHRYLTALEAMTLSEVAGDVLILSNEAGFEMVFTRIGPAG